MYSKSEAEICLNLSEYIRAREAMSGDSDYTAYYNGVIDTLLWLLGYRPLTT